MFRFVVMSLLAVAVACSTVVRSYDACQLSDELNAGALQAGAVQPDTVPRSVLGSERTSKVASDVQKSYKLLAGAPWPSRPAQARRSTPKPAAVLLAGSLTLQADHVRLQI